VTYFQYNFGTEHVNTLNNSRAEVNMRNFAFVIWMLLWPIVYWGSPRFTGIFGSIGHAISKQQGPYDRFTMALGTLVILLAMFLASWYYVGKLLYEP
jgi:hypothetical protein